MSEETIDELHQQFFKCWYTPVKQLQTADSYSEMYDRMDNNLELMLPLIPNLPPLFCITCLRTYFLYREKLTNWFSFRDKVKTEFLKTLEEEEVNQLLRGLL